jgi:hypothetical protein
MGLEVAGHFRQYTAKRRTAMSIKTCPALKKKKSFKTKIRRPHRRTITSA